VRTGIEGGALVEAGALLLLGGIAVGHAGRRRRTGDLVAKRLSP